MTSLWHTPSRNRSHVPVVRRFQFRKKNTRGTENLRYTIVIYQRLNETSQDIPIMLHFLRLKPKFDLGPTLMSSRHGFRRAYARKWCVLTCIGKWQIFNYDGKNRYLSGTFVLYF